MESGPKKVSNKRFVDAEEIKGLGENWSSQAKIDEPARKYKATIFRSPKEKDGFLYGYNAYRQEESKSAVAGERIEDLHGESIIKEVIPRLLGDMKPGQKLKILDNGGGAGLFADQIREIFGDRVEVYSTGLSKQSAREYRKEKKLSKLHENDLKWRSIQELSDYPEFGLIIDTYGEQYYRSDQHMEEPNLKEFYKHVEQVVKKLLPGGYATLAPVSFSNLKINPVLGFIKENFGVEAYWGVGNKESLKLKKPKI